jgi:TRAP-type C4-dicarboxylate transport system permease small subunit
MVFTGISYGIKNGSHMRIDMLEHFFPKLRNGLGILADLSFLTFSAYMIKPGISVVESLIETGQTSPAGEIPMYIVYAGLLVGFLLVLFRIIQKYIMKFLQKKSPKGEN